MLIVKSFIYLCLYANAKGKLRVERMMGVTHHARAKLLQLRKH